MTGGCLVGVVPLLCPKCGEFFTVLLLEGQKRYHEFCQSCHTDIRVWYDPEADKIEAYAVPVS